MVATVNEFRLGEPAPRTSARRRAQLGASLVTAGAVAAGTAIVARALGYFGRPSPEMDTARVWWWTYVRSRIGSPPARSGRRIGRCEARVMTSVGVIDTERWGDQDAGHPGSRAGALVGGLRGDPARGRGMRVPAVAIGPPPPWVAVPAGPLAVLGARSFPVSGTADATDIGIRNVLTSTTDQWSNIDAIEMEECRHADVCTREGRSLRVTASQSIDQGPSSGWGWPTVGR